MSEGQTEASVYQQAENGKTELSLMHFTIKNPRWQPPQESSVFISHLKEKVQHDAQGGPSTQLLLSEAPLCTSLQSNEPGTGVNLEYPAAPPTPNNECNRIHSVSPFWLWFSSPIICWPVSWHTPSSPPPGYKGETTASSRPAPPPPPLPVSWPPCPPPSSRTPAAAAPTACCPRPSTPRAPCTAATAPPRTGNAPRVAMADRQMQSDRFQLTRFFFSMSRSDSRVRSNTLHSEFASAEMSLHAIYLHEVPSRRHNQQLTLIHERVLLYIEK